MKKPLIVGNWKLYVSSLEEGLAKARALVRGSKKTTADIVLCPPTPFLQAVTTIFKKAGLTTGAQTVSLPGDEKRTGEVTAVMIASLGASYVIVGHSERRAQGESDDQVQQMLQSVLSAKLSPIVCIGEHSRDNASGDYFGVIENQLRSALAGVAPKDVRRFVIAYEPVWAIGKSATDAMTPSVLEETVLFIRKILADLFERAPALSIPILYGGSVEPSNAELLMNAGIAGFLVGHASVEPLSLLAIAQASTGMYGSR